MTSEGLGTTFMVLLLMFLFLLATDNLTIGKIFFFVPTLFILFGLLCDSVKEDERKRY